MLRSANSTHEMIIRQMAELEGLVEQSVAAHIGTAAFRASRDAEFLAGIAGDTLTDDAKALSDLMAENDRDAASHLHFGANYSNLTPREQLQYCLLYSPLGSSVNHDRAITETVTIYDSIAENLARIYPTVGVIEFLPNYLVYSRARTGETIDLTLDDTCSKTELKIRKRLDGDTERFEPVPLKVARPLMREITKVLGTAICIASADLPS